MRAHRVTRTHGGRILRRRSHVNGSFLSSTPSFLEPSHHHHHQHLNGQQHQRRTLADKADDSSSIFPENPFSMAAMKRRVKESFLAEAAKEDSRLWRQDNDARPVAHQLHDELAMDAEDANTTDASTLLQHSLSDMLLLDTEPLRYWPNLPSMVQPLCSDVSTDDGVDVAAMINDPFVLTQVELSDLARSMREDLIRLDGNPAVLQEAAGYFFTDEDKGKKVRPIMIMLLSRALSDATANTDSTNVNGSSVNGSVNGNNNTTDSLFAPHHAWQRSDLAEAQRRLAESSEMIHVATLFHDDVIDKADSRRGRPSVHQAYGSEKTAILAGDYLLARTNVGLARLRNVDVFEAMSTIIEHLVRGEVMQMAKTDNDLASASDGQQDQNTQRLQFYLRKNFYKTASLMAHACRSAAMLGGYDDKKVAASYAYGKHMGTAFQLVDDILDYTGTEEQLGKPPFGDLKSGLATAPVLFAAQQDPTSWQPLLDRQFSGQGDVDLALDLLAASDGMERTKRLARVHAEKAMDAVLDICSAESGNGINTTHRDALIHLAYQVVSRTK